MSLDRTALRIVVPTTLAIGIVAALVSPLLASPTPVALATTGPASASASEQPEPTSRRCHEGAQAVGRRCPRSAAQPAGRNLTVSIPAVAFTETVVARDGHLRTPVLLADDQVTGRARLVGAVTGPGCTANLHQGVPAWLDCSIAAKRGQQARLLVTLSDGRTVMKEITFG